jgi:uncharacterized protein
MGRHRTLQVVVKASAYCNPHCTHCQPQPRSYSRPGGKAVAVTRKDAAAMYRNLRYHLAAADERDRARTWLEFAWHGSNPLDQPIEFYRQTLADQNNIFGSRIPTSNTVHANLTVSPEIIPRLRAHIGEPQGGMCPLPAGHPGRHTHARILHHLEALQAAGYEVGCITTLTTANAHAVGEASGLLNPYGIDLRVLPQFHTSRPGLKAAPGGSEGSEVGLAQEQAAVGHLVQRWLEGESWLPPAPVDTYVRIAACHLTGVPGPPYTARRTWLPLLLVDTDGQCYTHGEPYGDPAWTLGNIFTTPYSRLLNGKALKRSAVEAECRALRNCPDCPFLDACGTTLITDTDSPLHDHDDHRTRLCTARTTIAHIVQQIQEHPSHPIQPPTM